MEFAGDCILSTNNCELNLPEGEQLMEEENALIEKSQVGLLVDQKEL